MNENSPTPQAPEPYTIDECLIVAAVGYQHGWPSPVAVRDQLTEISAALRKKAGSASDEKHRNYNGIKRKYEDLRTHRPSYEGKPTRDARNDLLVIALYEQFPEKAIKYAREARIKLLKEE